MPKLFISGGSGFLGKLLVPRLQVAGYEVSAPGHEECDLAKREDCVKATKDMDIIVHAAAVATSRKDQTEHPADTFYKNTIMMLQILEAAKQNNIQKIILVSSRKAYPSNDPPQKESYLLEPKVPETTDDLSGFYGLSKWLEGPVGRAYALQFGIKVRVIVFANLYGPGDKFDYPQPPLVPNMIKKVVRAQQEGSATLDLGDNPGNNMDLLYGDDAADLLVRVVEKFGDEPFDIINGGAERSVEIKELADEIVRSAGFNGKITWSASKSSLPNLLDITKAKTYGWAPSVALSVGIKSTVDWYTNCNGKKAE